MKSTKYTNGINKINIKASNLGGKSNNFSHSLSPPIKRKASENLMNIKDINEKDDYKVFTFELNKAEENSNKESKESNLYSPNKRKSTESDSLFLPQVKKKSFEPELFSPVKKKSFEPSPRINFDNIGSINNMNGKSGLNTPKKKKISLEIKDKLIDKSDKVDMNKLPLIPILNISGNLSTKNSQTRK